MAEEIIRDAFPPGRLYAVCCAAEFTAELLDRFLRTNQQYQDQGNTNLVFVDDMTSLHTEESQIGDKQSTSPTSPFIDQSPEECHRLLYKLRKDIGAEVDYEQFAILDERSKDDDTVLLVQAEAGHAETVRATFEVANMALGGLLIGDVDADEFQELAANSEGGVLRSLF